jgi:rRNA maturation protein Rpf1
VLKRASKLGFKNIILVYEFHGNPSELQPYTITKEGWEKKSPIKFNPILIEKIPKEGYNVEFKGNCFEIKEIFDDDFSEQYENKAVLSIDDTHLRITSNEKELIVLKLVK